LLPHTCGLPQMAGGSASALSLSRPARALLKLRPTGSLSRPRRPLSRGSSPSGYPAEPLVSFQINRQLSGWILPPQVFRAFGAHGQHATLASRGPDPADYGPPDEAATMHKSLIAVSRGRKSRNVFVVYRFIRVGLLELLQGARERIDKRRRNMSLGEADIRSAFHYAAGQ
jgi:hypothetical protein